MRHVYVVMVALCLSGCSRIYTYTFAIPSTTSNLPADSLKWIYSGGIVTDIPVRSSNDETLRLQVDDRTIIYIMTTEKDEYRFLLRSLQVEDKGDGLLGSTTIWRGYDTRQGAERSVIVREIAETKVWSGVPAYRRLGLKK